MAIIEADRVWAGAATCEVKEGGKKGQKNLIRTGPCKNKEAHTAMHKSRECYWLQKKEDRK